MGAADDAEPDGDLGRGEDDVEHDGHLGDAEPDSDLGWGEALGSVPTPTAPRPRAALHVGYQDGADAVTQASFFLNLVARLAAVGHRLRPHKCFAWAPACEGLELARRPLRFFAAAAIVPIVVGGVAVLGGAIRGEMSIEVDGRADFLTGPAIKRAERAVLLAERIRQFAVAAVSPIVAPRLVPPFEMRLPCSLFRCPVDRLPGAALGGRVGGRRGRGRAERHPRDEAHGGPAAAACAHGGFRGMRSPARVKRDGGTTLTRLSSPLGRPSRIASWRSRGTWDGPSSTAAAG